MKKFILLFIASLLLSQLQTQMAHTLIGNTLSDTMIMYLRLIGEGGVCLCLLWLMQKSCTLVKELEGD